MILRAVILACFVIPLAIAQAAAAGPDDIYRRENLVAWCIVPFDSQHRTPEQRAEMLQRLGFHHFAYDWRAEHLPSFDRELSELERRHIELSAVWFPSSLNADARTILAVLEKHGIKTELWVSGGGAPTANEAEQRQRVTAEADRIKPIAEAAARQGCKVGLYNHGGWFGEPENQLAIIDQLKRPNVGIVYNLHHGHDQVDRLPALLKKMLPHLLCINLNGMVPGGDKLGQKIVPLGQGSLDLEVLRTIRGSGYRGPIGILGHTQDDAEARLLDNLDGLAWLLPQLDGHPPAARPQLRTGKPASAASNSLAAGFLVAGRAEYRTPPITVECRATLRGKQSFNILVACDTKKSATHWEIFTMPSSGRLAAYLPGMRPEHVNTKIDVCDNRPHAISMQFEPRRVRLYVDGELAGDSPIEPTGTASLPGDLAFGRLVEGSLGCDGSLEYVHLRRGIHTPVSSAVAPEAASDTLGLWRLASAAGGSVKDLSPAKNDARAASPASAKSNAVVPPPGNQLTATNPKLKVVLLDRSAEDVYMAVKVDSEGQVFVGGREAVFVFEPDKAGYRPKRELLRFPDDSIIIGLEFRGNDLYVLTSNALYRVPDGRKLRAGLRPERILWGLPLDLHVSFHCLAWGPQGDLYLDHGDPLLNFGDWSRPDHWGHWTLFAGPQGTPVPYTGQGAVLRVRPDGSNPRVIAGGLRGPVGLTFDARWNLFTNDNDHESRADQYAPARMLHVTPHIDFAWPRGWMASKSPDRADLVEPLSATLGRGVPCDLAWYDEPLLAGEIGGRLLMCRWDRNAVASYKLSPRGASFAAEETTVVSGANNARPVGVAVGRGGRLFVTALYMAGNMASPYCVSDLVMVTRADDSADTPFESYDVTQLTENQLWAELSTPSWERRSRAHQEILRRGGPLLTEAVRRLQDELRSPVAGEGSGVKGRGSSKRLLMHLPWLASAEGSDKAFATLRELAHHADADIRSQAVSALAELPPAGVPPEVFVAALADAQPRVQLTALAWFFDSLNPFHIEDALPLARSNDTYLRQTATTLLAARATPAELDQLLKASDEPTRLAAVLAAGRKLTVPGTRDIPDTRFALSYPKESAFFKTKLHFYGQTGETDLATLGRIGSFTMAGRWKLGEHSRDEEALFALLSQALDDPSDAVRLQAAYWLSLLHDPRSEPKIEGTKNEVAMRRLQRAPEHTVDRVWSLGPLAGAATPPEQGVIDLTATYKTADGAKAWQEAAAVHGMIPVGGGKSPAGGDVYLYSQLQSGTRQEGLLAIDWPGPIKAWHNGTLLSNLGGGASAASETLALIDMQPGTNDLLVRLSPAETSQPQPGCRIRVRASGPLVVALPEKLDSAQLTARLREASSGSTQAIPSEFISVDWSKEISRGDAAQGRRLFGSLACAKCHAITAGQKGGGAPSLAEAKRRFTVAYAVESILIPSKQVAEPFRATTILKLDGRILTGLVTSESADELEILLPDATRQVIRKADVEERSTGALSPMPQGLVRSPQELRDLLAYLLSDQPLPP